MLDDKLHVKNSHGMNNVNTTWPASSEFRVFGSFRLSCLITGLLTLMMTAVRCFETSTVTNPAVWRNNR